MNFEKNVNFISFLQGKYPQTLFEKGGDRTHQLNQTLRLFSGNFMGHFKAAFFQNIIGELFMLFISCSSLLGFYLHMISRKDTDMKKPSCFKRLEKKVIKR